MSYGIKLHISGDFACFTYFFLKETACVTLTVLGWAA